LYGRARLDGKVNHELGLFAVIARKIVVSRSPRL
jgi:hypothetical protein